MLTHTSHSHRGLLHTFKRHFGGGHHYKREKIFLRSANTYQENPVEKGDLEAEFGKRTTKLIHNRIVMKVLSKTNVHRHHLMDNMRRDQRSAYQWFSKLGMFKNQMFLKLMAAVFDTAKSHEASTYDEPVSIHENSVFLYKSNQSSYWVGSRVYDYFAFSALFYGLFITPMPLMWLPIIPYMAEFPKFYLHTSLVTLRADFLPHSEQVVFTKAGFFGNVRHSISDTKNLVKINAKSVPSSHYVFKRPELDSEFVWKDISTGEIYVFDTEGVWNEDGLNHPLLN